MNTQHDITVSGKPLNPPKPPAKPHMLLWIDTETTGLDPNQCELLEVGMQVTDLKAETRGGSLHLIVHPDNVRNWANHPEMLKAYEMHLANGLMLARAEAPKTGYDYKHTALNIHEFLNDQLSQYTLHPAGTNVDFDLRQLDVHLSRHLLPWELLQVPVALPQQGPALGRPRKSPMVPMPSHRLRRKDRVDAPTVRHTHGTRRPHRRRRSQNMGKTQARLPRPRPRPHRRTHQTGKRQAMNTRIHCDQYGIPTDISELEAGE